MASNWFNFGHNWIEFSKKALSESDINEATISLKQLLGKYSLKDKSFLDVGCGSGIFSIAAAKLKAEDIVSIDISKESIFATKKNFKRYLPRRKTKTRVLSILDKEINKLGSFDCVYCWGVAHHTGKMYESFNNLAALVKPKGILILAIYNRHWSSPLWNLIKKQYNLVPPVIQKIEVFIFYWIIALGKLIVTRKNPFTNNRRGMNYYYNVIDWLGGYPYEFASKKEVEDYFTSLGFVTKKFVSSPVPTGCNEYVLQKTS